jgi:hypothetical protein
VVVHPLAGAFANLETRMRRVLLVDNF